MRRFLLLALCVSPFAALAGEVNQFTFETSDGVMIHGDLYPTGAGPSAPTILLFHQGGGDARGEYGAIAPRLNKAGYNAIAIDQRRGGERLGSTNRTLSGLSDADYGYCDADPELEGALRYARAAGFVGKLVAWGSSYSAALVFQLAASHSGDIDAVLAFSPASGAPLDGCQVVQYLADVSAPALALRPQSEFEIESVQAQMAAFDAQGVETYVADPGVHGSSMLNAERVGAPTDATWTVVLDFLERALGD